MSLRPSRRQRSSWRRTWENAGSWNVAAWREILTELFGKPINDGQDLAEKKKKEEEEKKTKEMGKKKVKEKTPVGGDEA